MQYPYATIWFYENMRIHLTVSDSSWRSYAFTGLGTQCRNRESWVKLVLVRTRYKSAMYLEFQGVLKDNEETERAIYSIIDPSSIFYFQYIDNSDSKKFVRFCILTIIRLVVIFA